MSDPELPKGWAMLTVDQAGDARLGLQRSPSRHKGLNMKPYLRVANVREAEIDLSDVMEMHFTEDEERRYRLEPGDILLNEGQSPEFLGRPAMWLQQASEMYFTNSLIRFRCNPGISPDWALIVFIAHMHTGRFRRESRITTNIAHLALGRFKTVEFPICPFGEQQRIVDELNRRLSHVSAAATGLRAALTRLAGTRRSILNAVATGGLLHLDSDEWTETPTADVAEVKGGIQKQPKRAPVKNKRPFLRVANVGRGQLDLAEIHEIEVFNDEASTYALERGDLLVVEGNGSVDQIGRAAMWDGSIPECVHQNHLIRVRPGSMLNPEFLALIWNAPTTIDQLKAVASSTSGLHTLSTGKVKSVLLKIPDISIQERLVLEAERRLSLVSAAERSVAASQRRAEDLRRSLLVAALSGNLVHQDPDEESAEVLLERLAEVATRSTRKSMSKGTKVPAA